MGSELAATPSATPYAIAPSWIWSSTPVTVTVCGAFQFAAVKVRRDAVAAPSLPSLETTGMTTSAVGWLFKTTVSVALPPASLVTNPAVGATVMPAFFFNDTATAEIYALTLHDVLPILAAAPSATP